MAFTVTQATEFLRDNDKLNGSARQARNYLKIINDSCREVYSLGTYDHSLRTIRRQVPVAYTTGTATVSVLTPTTVTGSGVMFDPVMVGRFIRFQGQSEQYLITAYVGVSQLTIESYLGPSTLSGVTYEITQDRIAMPTNFRSIHKIVSTNASSTRGTVYGMEPLPFEYMNDYRQSYSLAEYPYFFSTKWEYPTSGNVPVGYIYTYPAPSTEQILTLYYNIWPPNLSSGSDEFPVPYELEGVIREFLLAYLQRENKDPNWSAQLSRAQAMAISALGDTRSNTASRQRVEWTPPCKRRWYKEPVIDPSVLSQLDP